MKDLPFNRTRRTTICWRSCCGQPPRHAQVKSKPADSELADKGPNPSRIPTTRSSSTTATTFHRLPQKDLQSCFQRNKSASKDTAESEQGIALPIPSLMLCSQEPASHWLTYAPTSDIASFLGATYRPPTPSASSFAPVFAWRPIVRPFRGRCRLLTNRREAGHVAHTTESQPDHWATIEALR